MKKRRRQRKKEEETEQKEKEREREKEREQKQQNKNTKIQINMRVCSHVFLQRSRHSQIVTLFYFYRVSLTISKRSNMTLTLK